MIFPIHDSLEAGPVFDSIIAKIYRGSFDSYNVLLSGEYKWFYLEEILFPVNILHLIFKLEDFLLFEDLFKKLFAYWTFYLMSKKMIKNKLTSSLGAIFYTIIINSSPSIVGVGYAIPALPYLFYLLNYKNKLNTKHIFFIFLIGLNSSLIHDYLAICLLLPLVFLLKSKNINLNILAKFFLTISVSIFLSAMPIFIAVIQEVSHRKDFIGPSYLEYLSSSIKNIFNIYNFDDLYIFRTPKILLCYLIFTISLFSKNKTIYKIIGFILSIFFFKVLFGSNLVVENLFNDYLKFLKGFNYTRMDKIFPFLFGILLILNISKLKIQYIKNILIFFLITSVISLQVALPVLEYVKLSFKNQLSSTNQLKAKEMISKNQYLDFFEFISNNTNLKNFSPTLKFTSDKSFKNYYRFIDYSKIKDLVKIDAVVSVGINPMIAAMNDIKIIDGYYGFYPKDYKIRFRKIIKKELDKDEAIKEYFDTWGNRLFLFYNDKNNLSLNFNAAKDLGAKYVISAFEIKKNELKEVCISCFQSKNLFLYRIY
jgi:hypothetical protein